MQGLAVNFETIRIGELFRFVDGSTLYTKTSKETGHTFDAPCFMPARKVHCKSIVFSLNY